MTVDQLGARQIHHLADGGTTSPDNMGGPCTGIRGRARAAMGAW
jgi:hypothetical protein